MMKKTGIILLMVLATAWFAAPCGAAETMGVDIHGFISQGYMQTHNNNFITDSEDGTFAFNEIGINFAKNLTDKMRLSMQFFSRDFGETDNSEIKIDYAYGDYYFKDWLGIRFGLLKAPHGFYNETRDIDMLRNSIFLPQSVYEEVVRSPMLNLQGAGLYGHLDMGVVGGLSYQGMYGTQTINQDSRMALAMVGYPSDSIDNDSCDVKEKAAASLVWATPLEGLRIGASYDNTRMDLIGHFNRELVVASGFSIPEGGPAIIEYDKYENIVYSLEYMWRNLTLVGEYIQMRRQYLLSLSNPFYGAIPGQPETVITKGNNQPYGWYAGAAYRFTDWFELGVYYSESDANTGEGDSMRSYESFKDYYEYLKDWSLTLRFDINPYWVFKLEYHDFEGAYSLNAWDNPASDDLSFDFFEKDWSMFAAKMTVFF